MRTTLNLDDDVAATLTDEARRRGLSLSRTANELLRAGVRTQRAPEPVGRYEPPSFDTGRPLIDVTDIAAALEQLDSGG